MLRTLGNTQIVASVIGEPADAAPDLLITDKASGRGNDTVLHDRLSEREGLGNVLRISVVVHQDFFAAFFRRVISVDGRVAADILFRELPSS